jgi:alkylated DNA nucleotide flippase Atl1
MSITTWTPDPIPQNWSDNKKRAIRLTQQIPAGRWSTFTNLAEAFNSVSGSKHTAYTFARLINDRQLRPKVTVPWHRVRNQKGQAIGDSARDVITDNACEWANVRFNAEADGQGLLHDGMARSSLWIDMHQLVANGEVDL